MNSSKCEKFLWAIMGVSVVGILDSSYLLFTKVTSTSINCFLFDGCNTVASSPYSSLFGVPLSLLGFMFYVGMLALTVLFYVKRIGFLRKPILLGGVAGFVFSLYFVYLQGFVIGAFCVYCLISAVSSTLLLCLSVFLNENYLSCNEK